MTFPSDRGGVGRARQRVWQIYRHVIRKMRVQFAIEEAVHLDLRGLDANIYALERSSTQCRECPQGLSEPWKSTPAPMRN